MLCFTLLIFALIYSRPYAYQSKQTLYVLVLRLLRRRLRLSGTTPTLQSHERCDREMRFWRSSLLPTKHFKRTHQNSVQRPMWTICLVMEVCHQICEAMTSISKRGHSVAAGKRLAQHTCKSLGVMQSRSAVLPLQSPQKHDDTSKNNKLRLMKSARWI